MFLLSRRHDIFRGVRLSFPSFSHVLLPLFFPPQPKSQFFGSPDVMFRAAYGGFPGQSHLASNMAAFNTAQALAAMQEESPQYKE